jgi:thioredoxin reductase (NADPH)
LEEAIPNWPAPATGSSHSVSRGISTMGVITSPLPFIGLAPCRIFIGAKPRTEMVRGFIELDDKDYVLTGPDLPRAGRRPRDWMLERDPYIFETNVPGVFAAGDVRGGSGKRVAAAVGEGSGAVSMVHHYLETV